MVEALASLLALPRHLSMSMPDLESWHCQGDFSMLICIIGDDHNMKMLICIFEDDHNMLLAIVSAHLGH